MTPEDPKLPANTGHMAHDYGIKAWDEADMRAFALAHILAEKERNRLLASAVLAADPIIQIAGEILDEGHMNTEHLARLRATFAQMAQRGAEALTGPSVPSAPP